MKAVSKGDRPSLKSEDEKKQKDIMGERKGSKKKPKKCNAPKILMT